MSCNCQQMKLLPQQKSVIVDVLDQQVLINFHLEPRDETIGLSARIRRRGINARAAKAD